MIITSVLSFYSTPIQALERHLRQPKDYSDNSEKKSSNPQQFSSLTASIKPILRLETSRDGVACVTGKLLIDIAPELLGRPLQYLRLTHRGETVPLAISNDNDGIISGNDTLYFLGSRPLPPALFTGSERLNYFSTTEPFHLYIDSTDLDKTKRFYQSLPEIQPPTSSVQSSLRREIIREEHHAYCEGEYDLARQDQATVHRSEYINGEGFVWRQIQLGNSFSDSTILPFLSPDSQFAWTMTFQGNSNNALYSPDHRIKFVINGDSIGFDQFDGYGNRNFTKQFTFDEYKGGSFSINTIPIGVPEYVGKPNYTESYNILRWKAQFSQLPIALNGQIEGGFTAQNSMKVPLYGFSKNGKVVVVDTVSKIFTTRLENLRSGNSVTASAGKSNQTISVNDSIFSNTGFGVSCVIYSNVNKGKSFIGKSQNDYNAIISAINSATSTDIIIITATHGLTFTNEFLTTLEKRGAIQANSKNAANSYTFISQNSQKISEDIGISSLSYSFFADSIAQSFMAEVQFPANKNYYIFAANERTFEKPRVKRVSFTDITQNTSGADYVIVFHPDFAAQAQRLATYRSNKDTVRTFLLNVEDIYDEFDYGVKSPLAIKRALRALDTLFLPPRPRYVCLLGDASWDARQVLDQSIQKDFIPTMGRPATDYWYSMLSCDDSTRFFSNGNIQSSFSIGRIAVQTSEQADNYIDKVIEYESAPAKPWMKNFLFLTGGDGTNEIKNFRNIALRTIENRVITPFLCGTYKLISKRSSGPTDVSPASEIRREINSGTVWMNYIGHGSQYLLDMDFGMSSDFANYGKYSIFSSYSCQTGDFAHYYYVVKNEDYIRAKGKGCIASIGTTGFGFVSIDEQIQDHFFTQLGDTVRRMGDILRNAKSSLIPFSLDQAYCNTIQQYSLIGDPMVHIAISKFPDLYLLREDTFYENKAGRTEIAEDDSTLYIRSTLRNAGTYSQFDANVLLVRTYGNRMDSVWMKNFDICNSQAISCSLPIANMPGKHILHWIADPSFVTEDQNRTNNERFDTLEVYPSRAFPLDPLPNWNIYASQPEFIVLNPLAATKKEISMRILNARSEVIRQSQKDEIIQSLTTSVWKPNNFSLPSSSTYILEFSSKSIVSDSETEWISIPFHTTVLRNDSALVQWKVTKTLPSSQQFTHRNLSLDTTTQNISAKLSTKKLPFTLVSAAGKANRTVIFNLGDIEQVRGPFDRGFSVFIFSDTNLTVARLKKRFDTFIWKPDYPQTAPDTIRAFLSMIRDSVKENDYVVIGNCDESWSGIANIPDVEKEIRQALKNLGAELSDSLRENTSYGLIARNGKKLYEGWQLPQSTDSTILTGEITEFSRSFDVTFSAIGPIQNALQFSRFVPDVFSSTMTISVLGSLERSDLNKTFLTATTANVINFTSNTSNQFPYLTFSLSGTINKRLEPEDVIFQTSVIDSVEAYFVPSPEIAIKPNSLSTSRKSLLRGDENSIIFGVENLSRRVVADNIISKAMILPASGLSATNVEVLDTIESIQKRGFHEVSLPFYSDRLATLSNISITASITPQELYSFNNTQSTTLEIFDDTSKPTIVLSEIRPDRSIIRELQDNSPVTLNPLLLAELRDNSFIPFTDTTKLNVRLGLKRYPNMIFGASERVANLERGQSKIKLYFNPNLDYGTNDITFLLEDGAGNRDTITQRLYVSSAIEINDAKLVPNPLIFGSGNQKLYFEIASRFVPEKGYIEIVNSIGQQIMQHEFVPITGENRVDVPLLDSADSRLPAGVYFVHVRIESKEDTQTYLIQSVLVR